MLRRRTLRLENLEDRFSPAAVDLSAAAIPDAPAQHEVGHLLGLHHHDSAGTRDGAFQWGQWITHDMDLTRNGPQDDQLFDGVGDASVCEQGMDLFMNYKFTDRHNPLSNNDDFIATDQAAPSAANGDLSDAPADEADGSTILMSGYVKVKKLNSGGG